jgi:CubicO group peptidase (beta-lactamase class C family)
MTTSPLSTTTTSLPADRPSAEGVDARGIAAFLDALEAHPDVEPHGLMILRHGRVVAQGWWTPRRQDRISLLYSLSKTFTSTALGFAVDEGLLSMDDLVIDHFPEFADEVPGRSRTIRIRHLAAMASGHTQDMGDIAVETDPAEPVRGFLLHEPEEEPGTWFQYNQPCTYTIAAIIQRKAGTTLLEYLRPRVLDPIGIGPVAWQEYPAGRNIGYSGLHATTDAVARLGLLHLQDGVWDGRQVLPEGWAAEVRTKRVDNPREPEVDWRQGYGYQVWIARHGYRGDGAFGQFCLILPEQDVVVALNSAEVDMQAVLNMVWEHLLPAFDGPAAPEAEEDALAERLGSLALPVPERTGAAPADADGPYAPASFGVELPAPASVTLQGDVLRIDDGAAVFAVPVGRAGWTTVDAEEDAPPVAVASGWHDGGLEVDLHFLETPHRLALTLRPDRTFTAHWEPMAPLGSTPTPLSAMRAPRPLG